MLKLEFKNAEVVDLGYGVSINDVNLDKIVSTALSTRVDNKYNIGEFRGTCDVLIQITQHAPSEMVELDGVTYDSIKVMFEAKEEEYAAKKKEEEK